jgi:LysR family transcriptional regulator, hydrogen peroxide-inducible genes activator
MELHQLRYLCAVVATGSFTGAAELKGISQPSLSQQIRKLEQTVGAPLFTRLGRRARLTPAGEALHEHAQEILRHSREASQRIRQMRQSISGPLRVGSIPTVLPYLLAPRLADFVTLYPEVQVELKEATTTELVKQLQQGDLDVILVALPLRVSEVVCSELVRDPLMLAIPKNHFMAGQEVAHINAVQQERLLLLREGYYFRGNVLTSCTRARAEFHATFESHSLATIFSLVAAGLGISIVPAMSAPHSSGCLLLPLAEPKARRVGYARLRSSAGFKPLRAFTDWLRKSPCSVGTNLDRSGVQQHRFELDPNDLLQRNGLKRRSWSTRSSADKLCTND